MKKNKTLVAIVCLAAGPAMAQDGNQGPWQGDAELGVVVTAGNTETKNINAKTKVAYEKDSWRHQGRLEMLRNSDGGDITAEKYLANAKTEYNFTEHNYAFVNLNYENDRFSGYDYRVSGAAGYGRRLINRDDLQLDVEVGPGARRSRLKGDGTQTELLGRGAGNLEWKISKTSVFSQELSVEAGEEQTITRSMTALKSQVAGALSMKLSLTVQNATGVPAGVKNTDTETAVTLVYSMF